MARRFDILDIPGTGAHAAVCLARDRTTDGLVCLKVLRTAYAPGSTEAKRVRDEARLLARLDHPNIVRLIASLELAGRDVLIMEWVDGPPIARVVRRLGRIPVPVALGIAHQMASAVAYAYDLPGDQGRPLRLVHRDLNLTNALIGVDGRVRILDYGMARAEFGDREAETQVALLGTAGFTAPEGLVRIPDNPKLDVYSLGISLFMMITGHLPVLSRQRLSHVTGLGEQLGFARGRMEADGVVADPIEGLIRALCAYAPDDRPTMVEAAARIANLLPPDLDLPGWAETHVRPIQEARARTEPTTHEAWAELAFLEADGAAPVPDADARIRKFLASADWAERPLELQKLLLDAPGWTPQPLIEALRPYAAPWWQVFTRTPPVEGAIALLEGLTTQPTPEVRALCRRLSMHRDPRVATLARAIAARPA